MIGKYATSVGLIGNAASPRIYYVPYCIGLKSNTLDTCGQCIQDNLLRIPQLIC
jgi:hypothetical protein